MPLQTNPPRLLTQILDAGGDQDVALVSADSFLTYGALRARVRNTANALRERGVRRGERVVVVLPNGAAFPTAVLAAWQAGAVVVPLDPRSPAEQIATIARDCVAAAVVCDGVVFTRLEGRVREIPSLRVVVVEAIRPSTYPPHLDVLSFEEAMTLGGPDPEVPTEPGDLVALNYTSGSTGRPKGVMHSHRSLLASLLFSRDHIGVVAADRVLVSFPMYHLFSFRVLLVHLLAGATVIAAPDVLSGMKRAKETRPNALILVPAACALLLDRFAAALAEIAPLLRRVCIGSAAISPPLLDRLQALLPGVRIHIPYGMTEARIGFLEPAPGRIERRLVAADPALDLSVLDDTGRPVTEGVGELVLRGPALMIGYWHNRDVENEALQRDGFRTRDLMEVTKDGDRFLVGRKDDVISVGGEKVFPLEVESVLLAHPHVRDARVTGHLDPQGVRGQVVRAAIVLETGRPFDAEGILAHCRRRLEPYKLPAILEPVPEIPRNDMGKVKKIARV